MPKHYKGKTGKARVKAVKQHKTIMKKRKAIKKGTKKAVSGVKSKMKRKTKSKSKVRK